MINWYYILIASMLLFTFIALKEWKRRNKKRLLLRLIASIFAVGSLLLLAYPFRKTEEVNRSAKIILLTDGYSPDSLNSFLSNKNALLFTTQLSISKLVSNNRIQFIPDLRKFFAEHNNNTVHVFGNGFEKGELNKLNRSLFVFHAPQIFRATTYINWNQQLKPGKPLLIQGNYSNNSQKEIKIILQGFGESFDSTKVPAHAKKDFSLTTIPKHTGRAVYSLLAIAGNDTIQDDPVPLNIQPISPLKILLLSSSPDFEKTFLKNKLSQSGYEISASTVISKNRKNEQFINMHVAPSDLFSISSLEKFDVVITDDESVNQLNATQSATLRSAIEEKGLGLIVKISTEKNKSSFYSRFFPAFSLEQDKKPFILLRSSISDSISYKIKIEEPVCLRNQNDAQILLKDDKANTYASNIVYGQGRIVATTLNNTYTLALAGDNKSWQSLWSLLLEKAAKKKNPDESWQISPTFSFVNEPSALITQNNSGPLPAQVGDSKIYLQQDSLLSYKWMGTYWPMESGWQSLIKQNGRIQNWYAFDKKDWKILRDFKKISDTKKYISEHPAEFIPQSAGQSMNWTSHLKLYLVVLFFICCSILWIEQKLG